MRANTNIGLKDRQILTLNNFLGVDFSSSPLQVASYRASEMRNFINEYGVNHKRHGWNEVLKILDADGKPAEINGIFNYDNDFIVHAGKEFFKVQKIGDEYKSINITNSCSYDKAKIDFDLIKSQKSQAFYLKKRLYIIGCGDYLVYGTWNNGKSYELRRVANNEDTYIPLTTTSIDDNSVESDPVMSAMEGINLLSSYRKNMMVGKDSNSASWTVDTGVIDADSDILINVELLNDQGVVYIKDITNDGTNLICEDEVVGSVNFGTGTFTLNLNTKPPVQGSSNITITFKRDIEEYVKIIQNMKFGTLFGASGNSDRLFISGNPEYKNEDYYSESNDFTYFPENNAIAIGTDASAIVGYGRLSDSALIIYKEENTQESTIYYRTGEYQASFDNNGNLLESKTYFYTKAGSIGDGAVGCFGNQSLAGDNLMLANNGVFGISFSENTQTDERYARERSRFINEKLRRHRNLSEAVSIVYENRYYLAIDDVCYIADSRFKSSADGDMTDTFNYEWWFWDNMPVRVWAKTNDNLLFGTKNGQICIFDDSYVDKEYFNSEPGEITINYESNSVIFNINTDLKFAADKEIQILTDNVYELLDDQAVFEIDEYGKSVIKLKSSSKLKNNSIIFVESEALNGSSYIVKSINRVKNSFQIADENGNIVAADGKIELKVYRKLSSVRLFIDKLNDDNFSIKDMNNETVVFAVYGSDIATNVVIGIKEQKNVVAEWFSPIIDFGTNMYSKTMLGLTIATEPSINGKVEFGYETRKIERLLKSQGVHIFDFGNLDFSNFTFLTSFATSFSRKINERNVNYVIFKIVSNNEYDCAINSFSVIYKINKKNRGVW